MAQNMSLTEYAAPQDATEHIMVYVHYGICTLW